MIAFFLLPERPGGVVVLGLVSGIAAAIAAASTAKPTYSPTDMTAREKRQLRVVTSLVVIAASLAALAAAFFAPPHMWRGAALVGGYLPAVKAVVAYAGSFFLGIGLVSASGLIRPASGQAE